MILALNDVREQKICSTRVELTVHLQIQCGHSNLVYSLLYTSAIVNVILSEHYLSNAHAMSPTARHPIVLIQKNTGLSCNVLLMKNT